MKKLAFFVLLSCVWPAMVGCGDPVPPPAASSSAAIAFIRGVPANQAQNAAQLPSGSYDLYVMDAAGGTPTKVGEPSFYTAVDISHDGTKLAVTAVSEGWPRVYVMKADGSDPVLVSGEGWAEMPEFTPDGTRVFFMDDNTVPNSLWSAPVDGSSAPIQIVPSSPVGVNSFTVGPDGKIYVEGVLDGAFGLYVMDINGANAHQLTPYRDFRPSVSADGSKIVFASIARNGGSLDIYIADVAALQNNPDAVTRLTNTGGNTDPIFVGDKIYFVSIRDGNTEIYRMDLNGQNVERVTDDPAENFFGGLIS